MTPLDTARAIGALPGAIQPRPLGRFLRTDDDRLVDEVGIGWVLDHDLRAWTLDLTSAATGGGMLARVWDIMPHIEAFRADGDSTIILWDRRSTARTVVGEGPTLAIALAHVILARGSWT